MKSGNMLIAVILASALISIAQEKPPAATATPAAAAPNAQAVTTPAMPDKTKLAMTESYVIGPSDTVGVFVWKEPELTTKDVMVRPDGKIELPLLGDVKASGKTPLELADDITASLRKFIQDPNVTVTLNQMNSKLVYLIGEVGKTGPVGMTSGMTLLEAISRAGGLTDFANTKKMYILRNDGGKQQKIFVQYKQALRGNSSLNLTLKPGDTIVVP
jgi:polysaccharide export outer membrane protein